MKHLRKIFTFPLLLLITFSLYGCGTADVDQSKEKVVKTADGAKPTVNHSEQAKTEGDQPQQTPSTEENRTEPSEQPEPEQTAKAPDNSEQKKTSDGANKGTTVTKNSAPSAVVPTNKVESKKPASTVPTKPVNTNPGAPKTDPKTEPLSTVSLTIKGPKDFGTILSDSKINMKNGESILTVFIREAKAKKIHIDYRGSGATTYVQGMEDESGKWSFYEFDYGATSGWVFKLNGVSLTQSIGITSIKDGDQIECIYTE